MGETADDAAAVQSIFEASAELMAPGIGSNAWAAQAKRWAEFKRKKLPAGPDDFVDQASVIANRKTTARLGHLLQAIVAYTYLVRHPAVEGRSIKVLARAVRCHPPRFLALVRRWSASTGLAAPGYRSDEGRKAISEGMRAKHAAGRQFKEAA